MPRSHLFQVENKSEDISDDSDYLGEVGKSNPQSAGRIEKPRVNDEEEVEEENGSSDDEDKDVTPMATKATKVCLLSHCYALDALTWQSELKSWIPPKTSASVERMPPVSIQRRKQLSQAGIVDFACTFVLFFIYYIFTNFHQLYSKEKKPNSAFLTGNITARRRHLIRYFPPKFLYLGVNRT